MLYEHDNGFASKEFKHTDRVVKGVSISIQPKTVSNLQNYPLVLIDKHLSLLIKSVHLTLS